MRCCPTATAGSSCDKSVPDARYLARPTLPNGEGGAVRSKEQRTSVSASPEPQGTADEDSGPTAPLAPGPSELAFRPQPASTALQLRADRRTTGSGPVLACRYVLEDIIGRGGTSIVFRAHDLRRSSGDDLVAVKLLRAELRSNSQAIARMRHEFRQMQRLSHPGVVQVFDIDCDGDVWFMTMELVVGQTVKSWMQTAPTQSEALRVIGACCEALEHAHLAGVLHGDLKPTNVMVADDGAVKLIDFGSVPGPVNRMTGDSDSTPAVTALYASPQVLAGKRAEPRDDIFSLACLSYSILSGGRHPFGRRPSLEDGRAKSAPTYVASIPEGLFEVVERGLSAERERRPASASIFLRDLSRPVARSWMRADTALISLTESNAGDDPLDSSVGASRDGQSYMRLAVLALFVFSATVLFQHGSPQVASGASRNASVTAGTGEEPVAATANGLAPAQTTPTVAENPQPAANSVVSFDASTVHVTAGQPLVAITVKRQHGTRGRAAFAWRIERGTAQPGVDYQRIGQQVVRFIEGQVARTLFIPLITGRDRLPSTSARTFTVALEQISGGPALGRFPKVTVSLDPPPATSHLAVYQARSGASPDQPQP